MQLPDIVQLNYYYVIAQKNKHWIIDYYPFGLTLKHFPLWIAINYFLKMKKKRPLTPGLTTI